MLVVLALVGVLLGGTSFGVGLGLGGATAWAAWVWWGGPAVARKALGGRLASNVGEARLHNVVDGLCTAAGVPKPALVVVEDPAPNALVYGREPRHAVLLVTSGLLERVNRVELEGVVARELAAIKNHDTRPTTLAVAVLAVVGPLQPLADRVRRMATAVPAATADANGVAITRYPPALAAAYEKVRADGPAVRAGSGATAHLWFVPPADTTVDLHPPLGERIEALREL